MLRWLFWQVYGRWICVCCERWSGGALLCRACWTEMQPMMDDHAAPRRVPFRLETARIRSRVRKDKTAMAQPTAPCTLTVGDVVNVERPCLGHRANARALVVEVYDRRLFDSDGGIGTTLLFADGKFDGFSPLDRRLFGVTAVGHCAALEGYDYRSAMGLMLDYENQVFAQAFA